MSHAGVVTVFDLGQDSDDGTLYLVMEYLAGRDVDTVLCEDGPPEPATAVDWGAQTAAALHAAHTAGVAHRDLKPANLMLGPDGHIKILDFGIARLLAKDPGDRPGSAAEVHRRLRELSIADLSGGAGRTFHTIDGYAGAGGGTTAMRGAEDPDWPFLSTPPCWIALPVVRPLFDPVSGREVGSLAAGRWFLALARQGTGLLVEADGLRGFLADMSGVEYGLKVTPATEPTHLFRRPFWFSVPSTRTVFDPVTGAEAGSLEPGIWFLAQAPREDGLLVVVDGVQVLLTDISGIR